MPARFDPRLRRLRHRELLRGHGADRRLSNTTAAIRNGNGNTDTDSNAADFTVGAPAPQNSGSGPTPPLPPTFEIGEIQGAAHVSPQNGQLVTTTGIVTALKPAVARGFYIQDPTPDAKQRHLRRALRLHHAAPTVAVGDASGSSAA